MSIASKASLSDIALSWMKFVTTHELDYETVRPEIAESWQRCYEASVNPYDGFSYRVLDPAELKGLLEKHRDLIDIARPFMTNLYEFVKGSGFIVMLTDVKGNIMEAFGDEDTLKDARKMNFIKGANWSEEDVGTNAIGTAMVLKRPIQVSGPEHYCSKHHPWTCSAAPIFDQTGQVIGILDLSGPSNEVHLHTLGMVVAAEEAIREQMRIRQTNRELSLANKHLNNIFQTMSDGVITFNEQGIVTQVNPASEQILGRRNQDLVGSPVEDMLGDKAQYINSLLENNESFNDVEIMVDTINGLLHCLASAKPITDDHGVLTGGLMLVRPIEKVQNLVNRFSGAQATFHFKDIIGSSNEMQETIRVASLAAPSMCSVLLQGESGTGKELFAQAIHNRSPHRKGPFVAVNCGAIPRELIASELFGYEEGAFTGAKPGGRPGKFELASGGTLFLDEIGDMPLEQQVALLRVLQEKKVTRIGGNKVIPVDFRIICATNKNLSLEVEKGNFREDLFYRVKVISIDIPPLRQRPEDIPVLFEHFLNRISKEWRRSIEDVDPDVMDYLRQYHWPGNVRELQNVVERMISIADGNRIDLTHLPAEIYIPWRSNHSEPSSLSQVDRIADEREKRKKQLAEQECQEIVGLLAKHGGNVSQVAKELGLSRNTLYRKMKTYNIN